MSRGSYPSAVQEGSNREQQKMPVKPLPRKVGEYIKIEFWKCNVVGHRHRTERSALACMSIKPGEAGELKKLKRNLAMLYKLRQYESPTKIAKEHNCSDSNVVNAVNSSLKKAWRFANENGGNPYPRRGWLREDFVNDSLIPELNHYVGILLEMEVKLIKVLEI